MAIRYVLVVVNVSKALQEKNLAKYTYMIDSTGYVGVNGEGGNELLTTCKVKDTIQWTVTSINPGNDVSIAGINGQAVNSGMINVDHIPPGGVTSTQAYVAKAGTKVQYSMSLILDDSPPMSFDPFITATPRASEDESE
ncbi:hypothetical protein CFB82_06085 [Burkholderia sp. HI2714]|uniref:hypothetical protein n=1 Tax=Burkholderia sp. HI2714 TaxID=2015359 RepID=UPI000B7A0D9A|nr:hypothetical protein [Burkholderia sp. HI2714]OXJ38626.1 hypothetical protein CFB82_06085 [Burkholderia sp. HI2714]